MPVVPSWQSSDEETSTPVESSVAVSVTSPDTSLPGPVLPNINHTTDNDLNITVDDRETVTPAVNSSLS